MDVRNWSLNQIMQLPDCCFGRRRLIILAASGDSGAPDYDISETGLSEGTVVWGVMGWHIAASTLMGYITFKLGDKLPASAAEFAALEDMFPEMVNDAGVRSSIKWIDNNLGVWLPMRRPFVTAGRRVVVGMNVSGLTPGDVFCAIEISAFPTEVPDCLFSAHR